MCHPHSICSHYSLCVTTDHKMLSERLERDATMKEVSFTSETLTEIGIASHLEKSVDCWVPLQAVFDPYTTHHIKRIHISHYRWEQAPSTAHPSRMGQYEVWEESETKAVEKGKRNSSEIFFMGLSPSMKNEDWIEFS